MKPLLLSVIAAFPLLAAAQALPPSDPAKVDRLSADFRTLSRIADAAENFSDNRKVLLKIVDQDIAMLREPTSSSQYRWASLAREESGRKSEQKSLQKVYTEEDLNQESVTASNAYRVLVSVPKKRGIFSGNNRVYWRNVVIDWTDFDGRDRRQDLPVGRWIDPGDVHGVALPEIGRSVRATAYLGVESGGKKAVADLILLQATLKDDPANPFYPAVRRLLALREAVQEGSKTRTKTLADEALLALPGELDKRIAEQQERIERRRTIALGGELLGSIEFGDATPDVVQKLEEIRRLMGGNLDDQARGRAEIETLIQSLSVTGPVMSEPVP